MNFEFLKIFFALFAKRSEKEADDNAPDGGQLTRWTQIPRRTYHRQADTRHYIQTATQTATQIFTTLGIHQWLPGSCLVRKPRLTAFML